jgi:hypothetical protein
MLTGGSSVGKVLCSCGDERESMARGSNQSQLRCKASAMPEDDWSL